jgi:phosphatidylethanolamine-binding protein (PEBP) family uncharacterized protein
LHHLPLISHPPRIKVESDTFADGASRDEVMNAMAGHVLAKGELVGLYEAPLGSER